jgi:hypothetical protein
VVFAENTADDEEVVNYEQYLSTTIDAFCEREENNAPQMTSADHSALSLLVEKLCREYDNLWPVSTVHRGGHLARHPASVAG